MQKKIKEENETQRKALFVQRLGAYIIDIIIVVLVTTLISSFFIDTEKLTKLQEQQTTITNDYVDQKISTSEYISSYSDIYYRMSKANGGMTLLTIFLEVLYFVVYQLYNGGKTIGKKLMKIKVVSNDGDLTMNQMIFRSFIANSIIFNIIGFALMLFGSKSVYFYANVVMGAIQYIVIIVSVIMIMSKKNGCAVHDKLVHTTVIREN